MLLESSIRVEDPAQAHEDSLEGLKVLLRDLVLLHLRVLLSIVQT